MNKIYRILGKRGRITIPYEMRQRVGFGYNDVLSFTETELVLKGRRGSVRVEGERLSLGKYFAGDLVVRGTIVAVSREGADAKL